MSDLLIFLGLVGTVVALWGLVRGRVGWARLSSRKVAALALAGSFASIVVGGALADPPSKIVERPPATPPDTPAVVVTTTPPPAPSPASTKAEGVPDGAQPAVVERIVDGDTLWVSIDQPESGPLVEAASHQVRVLEIDTPETKHPDRPVECWGPEATRFAEQTLPVGSKVWLVADRENTDRYGRFLRYIWTDQGSFFNYEAVRQGFARAVLYEPNTPTSISCALRRPKRRLPTGGCGGRPATTTPPLPHPHRWCPSPHPRPPCPQRVATGRTTRIVARLKPPGLRPFTGTNPATVPRWTAILTGWPARGKHIAEGDPPRRTTAHQSALGLRRSHDQPRAPGRRAAYPARLPQSRRYQP